jgi:hypothetical protein
MAHYAFLDENNIVTEVIVGVNEDELIEGLTPEEWYGQLRGQKCVRTSYNTIAGTHRVGKASFRKNYAGIGFIYDEELDAFYEPSPYPSWIFNTDKCIWEAPIEIPIGQGPKRWDEELGNWVNINLIV